MNTKVIDTIRSAVQKLGVLAVGEELPKAEYRDCLIALNRVVDNYNTDGIFIGHIIDIELEAPYVISRCSIPPPTDTTKKWKNEVTFGKCMDYDTIAPIEFISLFFRESGNTDYALKEMSSNEYQNIAVKNVTAIPSRYKVEQKSHDVVTMYFDYIPQDNLKLMGKVKVRYEGTNSLGEPYNANDTIDWDYGVEAMVMYRLALELAPDYGVRDVAILAEMLSDIEGKLASANAVNYTMNVEGSYKDNRGNNTLRYNRARY